MGDAGIGAGHENSAEAAAAPAAAPSAVDLPGLAAGLPAGLAASGDGVSLTGPSSCERTTEGQAKQCEGPPAEISPPVPIHVTIIRGCT